MKKRLRKKYRIGEFQELCFNFSFEYKGDVNSTECEAFLKEFVENCVEAQGLDCDGYMTEEGCRLILSAARPTETSEEQRQFVKSWLEARSDVEVQSFSELEDLWY